MTHTSARKWYCSDRLTNEYKARYENGENFVMIKSLKILRSIIVNLGIILIAIFGLWNGGGSNVALVGLLTLAAYNGVEYVDYVALIQAYKEATNEGD